MTYFCSYVIWFAGLASFVTDGIEGRRCVLFYDSDQIFKSCGSCGVCRKVDRESITGTCDYHFLTKSGLFVNSSDAHCELKNHCMEEKEVLCQNINSCTGVCHPLYGTYKCQCKDGFFGKNCENRIDSGTTQGTGNNPHPHLYANVNNVVFTPIFFSEKSAILHIVLMRKGFKLKINVDNGREQLIYNESKCEKDFKMLNKFCLGLFRETKNIKLCKGMTSLEEKRFKNEGCLISLHILYPPRYDNNKAIFQYMDQQVMANLETASVAVYNNFESSVRKPVLNYTFDMINVHKTSDLNSKCSLRIKLVNCGKTMRNMPKVSATSDMAILWSLKILLSDPYCLQYGRVGTAWKVWKLEENHDELKDKPVLEMYQQNEYIVKEKRLTYGIYKIKLTLAVSFPEYVQRERVYCYFEVVQFPVQIIIFGGSLRSVYYKHHLSFKILTSNIPDRFEADELAKTFFTWRCDHPQENICKPFNTSDSVRRVTGPFPRSASYKFTLDAQTVDQSGFNVEQHQEVQVVNFLSSPVFGLVINCLKNCGGSTFKSNPQEIIHLKVSLEEPISDSIFLYYDWKYKCLDNVQDQLQGVEEIRMDGFFDNTVLIVDYNKLSVKSKYLFVASLKGLNSWAEIVIETDQPPSGVNCEVNPKSGIRGKTFFSISCKPQNEKIIFPSLTYEFYNRYEDEVVGRMLGYSMTGDISRVVLTRNKLFVLVTNFFGSSNETEIFVRLSPPPQNYSSTVPNRKSVHIGNYIDRFGSLSSRSDSAPSSLFWDHSTSVFLKSLVKENARELMGAILLQNTLHQIACEKLVLSVEKKFKCSTILNLATIMLHSTKTITDSLKSTNKNPRLMNTIRTKSFVTSVLQCSSVILEISFHNKYKSSEINIHDCLKKSTFYTFNTLHSLEHIVALQIFPSIRQWYESNSVHMFVEELIPDSVNDFDKKTVIDRRNDSSSETSQETHFYAQIIIFDFNPFWWGGGSKINTNVFSVRLFHGNKSIEKAEAEERLKYVLGFQGFEPALVSGLVTQPDPNKGPEVIDFEIAIFRVIPEIHSKTFVKFAGLENGSILRVLILKNKRPDFDLMITDAVNVTEDKSDLWFDTDSTQDDLFYYIGILPGSKVKVGETVNYIFVLFSARCVVWTHMAWMSGSKCTVHEDMDLFSEILTCSCTLRSLTIGGSVYIPTNNLSPFSSINLFLRIPDNPFIISFLLVVFLIFLILLIWTRVKDRGDKNKLSIFLLEDYSVDNTHIYLVGVFTGFRVKAGTTSNVGFKLFGEKDTSRTHVLSSSQRLTLLSGGDTWFLLLTPKKLGTLLKIQLWIDYTGSSPNWYCKKVFVCDISNYECSVFTVEKWFGVNIEEICLEKTIKSASLKEVNTFGATLSNNLVYGFRDIHFFLSLFLKHPRSVVTRTQRLAVALSVVLLSICLSIMLYSIYSPVFEDLPAYNVSSEGFLCSFICSVIATTFGLINMSYFRRCYSINRNTHHSHFHSGCEQQNKTTEISKLDSKGGMQYSKTKNNYCFELFCKYVDKHIKTCYMIPVQNYKNLTVVKVDEGKVNLAWMITLIVIVVSSYIIVVSSLTFGKVKTITWMTSLLISLVISSFVLLSTKVAFISLICSLRKVFIFDVSTHCIHSKRSSLHPKKEMYVKLHNKLTKKLFFDSYLSNKVQQNAIVVKKHTRSIQIWVAAFIIESIFILVLVYLIMGEFETFKYYHSSSTVCNEILNRYTCENMYYAEISSYNLKDDVLKIVIPKLFKTKWYNRKDLSSRELLFHETGWLNDVTSRLIGDPQLLQLRVQKNLCKVPSVMSSFTKNCFPSLTASTEDQKNYSLGWSDDEWTSILFHQSPWVFTKGVGVGIQISSDFYITEGSYTISLLNTLELAKYVTKNLVDTNWMDAQTRAIVLKFLTYNPNNNIFTSSYFVTEVFPTQYIKPTHTVKSIGFYYHKVSYQGIIFILFSVVFFVRLLVTINIMGVGTFFKDLWNCYDVFIFVVYFSTVVDFMQLLYLLGKEHEVVEAGVADKNVHLESVFYSMSSTIWSLCYTLISIAFRFVRITRINDRCRQYLSDLVQTKTELFWTIIISFVSLYRQFRLIMYFIEPTSVFDIVDILGFTQKYHPAEREYSTLRGEIVAFLLFQMSTISLFSFTMSLIHHHRQVMLRRLSLIIID